VGKAVPVNTPAASLTVPGTGFAAWGPFSRAAHWPS
jgi:hypothetical protein